MPPSRRGTGFVNLQSYLGLNQGGAQALGQGLGQQVYQQGREAQNAIDAAGMEARNKALGGIPDAGGTYAGPTNFGDAADVGALTRQVAEAQNTARATQDQTGRAQLLAQKHGPNTWGGSQLDSALAGAGAGAGQLGQAADGVGRLSQYLGDTNASVNQYIGQVKGTTNTPAPAPVQPTPAAPRPTTPAPTPTGPVRSRPRPRSNEDE